MSTRGEGQGPGRGSRAWTPYEESTVRQNPRQVGADGREATPLAQLAIIGALTTEAGRARLTATEHAVLNAILRETVRWGCRIWDATWEAPMSDLGALAGGYDRAEVKRAVRGLSAKGFIHHRPGGNGKTEIVDGQRVYTYIPATIRVRIPEGWEQSAGPVDLVPVTPTPRSEPHTTPRSEPHTTPRSEGHPRPGGEVHPLSSGVVLASSLESSLGSGAGGGATTRSRVDGTAPAPLATEAEEQTRPSAVGLGLALKGGQDQAQAAGEILTALADACRTGGHPLTRKPAVRAGIEAALATGYSPAAVLVGLGFWRAERFCSPRQIPEMTERAAIHGLPPTGASPAALLAEGARRFAAPGRRPTPKTARESATVLAISNYTRHHHSDTGASQLPPSIERYRRAAR